MLTLVVALLLASPEVKLIFPKDHVTFAVKLDGNAANAFLAPGTKVDVVLFETVAKGKATSTVLFENQLIVAVDIRNDPDKKEKLLTITLAVKPETAKALLAAEKKGLLRLIQAAPKL